MRTLKTNSDGSYSVFYYLDNLLLAEERYASASATATTPARTLVFSYDENHTPVGFQFKSTGGWTYYLYAKNAQSDITALYRRDGSGIHTLTHIANYEYDPWGKIIAITNPSGTNITNPDNSAFINPHLLSWVLLR